MKRAKSAGSRGGEAKLPVAIRAQAGARRTTGSTRIRARAACAKIRSVAAQSGAPPFVGSMSDQ